MAELVQFELSDGGMVFAEVAADEPGMRRAGRTADEMWVKAATNLDQGLDGVRSAANATLSKLQNLARKPDEIELEFGVRLTAAAGAVIANTSAEGHLQVRLAWTKP
jgi:Trypsin-co-occurring domain 1